MKGDRLDDTYGGLDALEYLSSSSVATSEKVSNMTSLLAVSPVKGTKHPKPCKMTQLLDLGNRVLHLLVSGVVAGASQHREARRTNPAAAVSGSALQSGLLGGKTTLANPSAALPALTGSQLEGQHVHTSHM